MTLLTQSTTVYSGISLDGMSVAPYIVHSRVKRPITWLADRP